MRSRLLVCGILIAATLAVYAQVRRHEFVNYDDYVYLSAIDTGWSADGVRRAFTRHIVSNWIPVTWLTLLVDYELYGRHPAGYLLTNVAIHAISAVLLFLWLQRWTGALGRSAFVAGVFALHPLHVESVAWFSERKDVLSGLLFMATLHAYGHYRTRPSTRRYLWVFAGLATGLMAKPMLVTLPFVLLLLDYWPLERIARGDAWNGLRQALPDKLPLLALALAASAVAIFTQDLAGSLSDTTVLTPARRVANAIDSYWVYIAQSVWPRGLAVFYPHPIDSTPALKTGALGLALVAVSWAAVRTRRPYLTVGWLWYLGTLVPVIGLVQVGSQAHADRYTYLPQIGLAIAFAWSAYDCLAERRWGSVALRAGGAALLCALALTSWLQVRVWHDTIALHEHAAAVTVDNFRAHNGLAAALRRAGRLPEAAYHYHRATELAPRSARTRIGQAEVLAELDRLDEAIDAYRAGLRLAPRHIRAHINLGHVLLRAGRIDEALEVLERARELDAEGTLQNSGGVPFAVSLHRGLAQALAAKGRGGDSDATRAAIDEYRAVLALRPDDAPAHRGLAESLARSGRMAEARAHASRAEQLDASSRAND